MYIVIKKKRLFYLKLKHALLKDLYDTYSVPVLRNGEMPDVSLWVGVTRGRGWQKIRKMAGLLFS